MPRGRCKKSSYCPKRKLVKLRVRLELWRRRCEELRTTADQRSNGRRRSAGSTDANDRGSTSPIHFTSFLSARVVLFGWQMLAAYFAPCPDWVRIVGRLVVSCF